MVGGRTDCRRGDRGRHADCSQERLRLHQGVPAGLGRWAIKLTTSNMADSLAQLPKEIDHEQEQGDE